MGLELNNLYLMDCMEGMKQFPDNYFELAIVDPPYGIGDCLQSKNRLHKKMAWNNKTPGKKYFVELFRVSKNQIIWGANYFSEINLPPGRIVHDKCDMKSQMRSLSDCDLASQSFNNLIKIYRYRWRGNCQGSKINWRNEGPDKKIHPTQKPIQLYRWLLQNYATPEDKILDTHAGSGASLIACILEKYSYMGFELDADYYRDAIKRINSEKAQLKLF